ncbi:hypothetical protein VTO42DRAFT_3320 [Malbranchea cinnamomea]
MWSDPPVKLQIMPAPTPSGGQPVARASPPVSSVIRSLDAVLRLCRKNLSSSSYGCYWSETRASGGSSMQEHSQNSLGVGWLDVVTSAAESSMVDRGGERRAKGAGDRALSQGTFVLKHGARQGDGGRTGDRSRLGPSRVSDAYSCWEVPPMTREYGV